MRLSELEPEFLTTAGVSERGNLRFVETIAEAQGVMLGCPQCFVAKGNTLRGVHKIICWSRERGADPEAVPLPGRWRIVGSSFEDLGLDAEPPSANRSVKLDGPGCKAHFHITNGEVSLCDDSGK